MEKLAITVKSQGNPRGRGVGFTQYRLQPVKFAGAIG